MTKTVLRFRVQAVDAVGIPVCDLKIGARFNYGDLPSTWTISHTDGDGYAEFMDEHDAPPAGVCFFVGDELCDTYSSIENGACYVLEF